MHSAGSAYGLGAANGVMQYLEEHRIGYDTGYAIVPLVAQSDIYDLSVGKGSAAVMHVMDFCLEEYIQYMQEHPHVALFQDGQLKYEIVRQYVGDADSFDILVTGRAKRYVSSLDNMGGVITVFEY